MNRLLIGALCLILTAPAFAFAFADDTDPEPTKKATNVAKSGDYTVTTERNGNITATKQEQIVWKTNQATKGDDGQVLIVGDRVVVAFEGVQSVLELSNGKLLWYRNGGLSSAKMTVKGEKMILVAGKSREVLDLRT